MGDEFRARRASLPPRAKGASLPQRSHPEPRIGVLVIGSITRADVPLLCERLRLLVDDGGADVVVCDVCGLVADIVAVEALANLRLTARRLGCRVRLRRPSGELEGLLDFCGLAGVLSTDGLALG